MSEENTFTIVDSNGEEIICEVLFTFESDETKKSYIVYTDNTKDENGNIKVYASIYKPGAENHELLPIESDREWKVIETVLKTVQEENNKGN